MAAYKIFFKRSVEKDLRSIPKKDLKRILDRMNLLAEDPRPSGSEKLTGQERSNRIRQGLYRIVYSIQDNVLVIWVVKVGHRKDVYRSSEPKIQRSTNRVRASHCFSPASYLFP